MITLNSSSSFASVFAASVSQKKNIVKSGLSRINTPEEMFALKKMEPVNFSSLTNFFSASPPVSYPVNKQDTFHWSKSIREGAVNLLAKIAENKFSQYDPTLIDRTKTVLSMIAKNEQLGNQKIFYVEIMTDLGDDHLREGDGNIAGYLLKASTQLVPDPLKLKPALAAKRAQLFCHLSNLFSQNPAKNKNFDYIIDLLQQGFSIDTCMWTSNQDLKDVVKQVCYGMGLFKTNRIKEAQALFQSADKLLLEKASSASKQNPCNSLRAPLIQSLQGIIEQFNELIRKYPPRQPCAK